MKWKSEYEIHVVQNIVQVCGTVKAAMGRLSCRKVKKDKAQWRFLRIIREQWRVLARSRF
jgi:hypothetical protein